LHLKNNPKPNTFPDLKENALCPPQAKGNANPQTEGVTFGAITVDGSKFIDDRGHFRRATNPGAKRQPGMLPKFMDSIDTEPPSASISFAQKGASGSAERTESTFQSKPRGNTFIAA
jgi:hypothetical protein